MSITETELVHLSSHISFLRTPTNIGFIKLKNEKGSEDIYIIDSGNDDTSGLKILDFIKRYAPSAALKAVINTHAHADHCGGNAILSKETACEIWASKGSAALMEYPDLETQLIWGGNPIHDITSKFLLAKPCHVDRTFSGGDVIKLPVFDDCRASFIKIEVISLSGHYVDQTGFLLTDTDGRKVFFGGDAFSGKSAIKKFWIQYLLDENETKESLHKISKIKADVFVPGHGEEVTQIEGIIELNLIAILETEEMILDELKTPKTTEEILKAVSERNSIPLKIAQFCLIGSTLRSYLSGLYEKGRITYEIKGSMLFWKKVSAVQLTI